MNQPKHEDFLCVSTRFPLRALLLLLFCSELQPIKILVMYGPCDNNLMDVLHVIHKATQGHVLPPKQDDDDKVDRRSTFRHLRHDLNDACQWISEDTVGVVAVASGNTTWQDVASIAEKHNMPHLITSEVCACNDSLSRSFDREYLEQVVFDFLQQEYQRDVIIIHGNDSQGATLLSTLLNSASVRVSHLKVNEETRLLELIETFFAVWNLADLSDEGRRLVFLEGGHTTDAVLRKLMESSMRNMRIKVLVVDSPEKWRQRLLSVTNYEVDIVIVSADSGVGEDLQVCPVAVEVLPTGSHNYASVGNCQVLQPHIKDAGDAILTKVQKGLEQCCTRQVKNEYTIWKSALAEKGVQTLKPVAIWSPSLGLLRTEMLDFTTLTLRIALLQYPPYIIINFTSAGEVILHDCVFKEMIIFLSQKMNFRYELMSPPNREWGSKTADGKWSGAIGMVTRGEADVVPYLTLTPSRKEVMDFSIPVATVYYGILVASPSEPPRTYLFLRPYKKEVWLAFCVVALLMSIILHKTHCVSSVYVGANAWKHKGLARFSNSLWCIFGAMLQQGAVHLPATVSARLVMTTWWLAVLVIMATYSANLIAFLAFPEARWLVQSLAELANHKTLLLMIDEGCPALEDFNKSQQEVYRKIRETYLETPSRRLVVKAALVQVVEVVITRKVVYVDDLNYLSQLVEHDYQETGQCRVTIASDTFSKMDTTMGFRRGSSLMPSFNKEIQQMSESGVLRHWRARYSPRRDECFSMVTTLQGGSTEVDLVDLQGAFYLLGLGFALSIAVLACEVMKERLGYIVGHNYIT